MFDARAAFKELEGRHFTHREFRERMQQMMMENRIDIPSEINLKDVVQIARDRGWLHEFVDTVCIDIELGENKIRKELAKRFRGDKLREMLDHKQSDWLEGDMTLCFAGYESRFQQVLLLEVAAQLLDDLSDDELEMAYRKVLTPDTTTHS